MTGKELRRLEIDELLADAQLGQDERVEAALELLRRREARHLRRQSKMKSRPSVEAEQAVGAGTGPGT